MLFRVGIKTKIILLILGISILSLILFAFIAGNSTRYMGQFSLEKINLLGNTAADTSKAALEVQTKKSLEKLAEDQAEISNRMFEKVEGEINSMADFAESLWNNPQGFSPMPISPPQPGTDGIKTLKYRLAPQVQPEGVNNELGLLANMFYILKPSLNNNQNLSTVYMGTESGMQIVYSPLSGAKSSATYEPRTRSWYTLAAKSGKLGWTETYEDAFGNGLMVTCSKPCYNSGGTLMGVVATDVTLKAMNDKIINTQIGDLGYAYLIDEKGKIIARPGLSEDNKKWDESFEITNILESGNMELKKITEEMIAGNSGIELCNFGNAKKYIAYATLSTTRWSLAMVLPEEEINKSANEIKNEIKTSTAEADSFINQTTSSMEIKFISIFIVIVFLVIFLSIILSNRMVKPILALRKGVMVVGNGDLNYSLNVKTNDEIEDLANAFNNMTQDLKTYIINLEKTTAEKEHAEGELKVAKSIQASMLPSIFPPFPERTEFDLYASMEPAKEVGGDFYDFFMVDNDKLFFVIGDVSGKGVPAALFMVITKTLIKNQALHSDSVEEIFTKVNNLLCEGNEELMFVTACLGMLNINTGELLMVNAGHNPPLLCRKESEFEWLSLTKDFVLGGMENIKYRLNKMTICPGDKLFLYTDGVTEAMNVEKKLFLEKKLKEVLDDIKDKSLKEIVNGVKVEIKNHAGEEPQSDDITMLILKYK